MQKKNVSSRQTPITHSFCRHVLGGRPLVVCDARSDPVVRQSRAIADLGIVKRQGSVLAAPPNTNLIVAKTLVPQLRGEIKAGRTVLATAAMALPAGAEAGAAPGMPDLAALEELFRREGVRVSAIDVAARK